MRFWNRVVWTRWTLPLLVVVCAIWADDLIFKSLWLFTITWELQHLKAQSDHFIFVPPGHTYLLKSVLSTTDSQLQGYLIYQTWKRWRDQNENTWTRSSGEPSLLFWYKVPAPFRRCRALSSNETGNQRVEVENRHTGLSLWKSISRGRQNHIKSQFLRRVRSTLAHQKYD